MSRIGFLQASSMSIKTNFQHPGFWILCLKEQAGFAFSSVEDLRVCTKWMPSSKSGWWSWSLRRITAMSSLSSRLKDSHSVVCSSWNFGIRLRATLSLVEAPKWRNQDNARILGWANFLDVADSTVRKDPGLEEMGWIEGDSVSRPALIPVVWVVGGCCEKLIISGQGGQPLGSTLSRWGLRELPCWEETLLQ